MSVAAMGRGIAAQADANTVAEMETAVGVMILASCYLPLMEAYSTELNEDQFQYEVDTAMIISNPTPGPGEQAPAAKSSEDYQKYQIDSSNMGRDTGAVSNMMDRESSQAQSLGNVMGEIYQAGEPATQLQKATVGLIAGFNSRF